MINLNLQKFLLAKIYVSRVSLTYALYNFYLRFCMIKTIFAATAL